MSDQHLTPKDTIILEAKNVTKKFGGLTANNNVCMNLREHEILGLIGANGAGKTTLFNMIAGAFHPTSGEILFRGKNVEKLDAHHICRLGIGRTYQIVQPFSNLTVHENVMVGALLRNSNTAQAAKKADEVLEFVGLAHRRDIRGRALSLPELKRMEVARALATEPTVLLLDEVMAGLNPTESAKMITQVQAIRDKGITIIIIEHVMKAIMSLSDRIFVLNQGSIIAEGTPHEVANNEQVQASYFGEKKYA